MFLCMMGTEWKEKEQEASPHHQQSKVALMGKEREIQRGRDSHHLFSSSSWKYRLEKVVGALVQGFSNPLRSVWQRPKECAPAGQQR